MRSEAMRVAIGFAVITAIAASPDRPEASPAHDHEDRAALRPVAGKPAPFTGAATRPAIVHDGRGGTLAGKTVYVSAGHGWMFSAGAWRTQRGNTHDLVEDFITAEGVNQYLIGYLQAMGAYVVPIRESDANPNLVVVDDGEAAIVGDIAELPSTDVGWGAFEVPFDNIDLQPFALGGARLLQTSASETGRATFTAAITERGFYNVYVAYVQGPDRAADAHYVVRHAGGEAHVRVDQRRHGSTWMLLGRWYFDGEGTVAIANDSTMPGAVVSFDAVRFGGGMSPHSLGGATTGRPSFESAGRYSTQLLGAPRDVYDHFGNDGSNDVAARPRFAAWEHEDGEDAVYLAVHTNAPDPGRGTMSIAYGNTFPCCAGLGDFAGTAGSLELLHAVHDELVGDLRAAYDPEWPDVGKRTASLGELNPTHNSEMPAILVEVAFHDTGADADALRDPRFRQVSARAMAQGIARYFATKDGRALVLAPEPPRALRVENAGERTLRISWRPPAAEPGAGDAPTSYRVMTSSDGYAFDDGVVVTGESHVLAELPRAALRFVRVVAINEGGESLPTEVVGARAAANGTAPVLVVGGFDRLDRFQMIREAAPLVGTIDRMLLDRMNDGSYAARHGQALADAGFAFDGATAAAIAERDLDLAAYRALDWLAGEQASALSPAIREQLAQLVAGEGHLLVTGSELVWALADQGAPEDQQFARDVLRVSLAADDAETYDVSAVDGPFGALAPISFLDTASGGYDVDFPDMLAPGDGATAVVAYQPSGAVAAIAWERGIVLGFPFEMVQTREARRDLAAAAMTHFGVERDADQPGDPEPEAPAGCGCASGDAGGLGLIVIAIAMVVLVGRRRRQAN